MSRLRSNIDHDVMYRHLQRDFNNVKDVVAFFHWTTIYVQFQYDQV